MKDHHTNLPHHAHRGMYYGGGHLAFFRPAPIKSSSTQRGSWIQEMNAHCAKVCYTSFMMGASRDVKHDSFDRAWTGS